MTAPAVNPGQDARREDLRRQIEKLSAQVDTLRHKAEKRRGFGPPRRRGLAARAGDTLRATMELGFGQHFGEVDAFGFDTVLDDKVQPWFDFLFYYYFRVRVAGLEHIPMRGRALLVCNHAGALPYDSAMLKTALRHEHPAGRDLRFLVEDFLYYLPFLGTLLNRTGGVRACQENAEALLRNENLVAVFPEGVKGLAKPWAERYRLQRFGRGGFVRLALRTGAPIIPVAIVGSEEVNPVLLRSEKAGAWLGLPFFPVTPTFPLLGPLGLLPLPSKWRIVIGEPVPLAGAKPADAGDYVLVSQLAEDIRGRIQALIGAALGERRSVVFG